MSNYRIHTFCLYIYGSLAESPLAKIMNNLLKYSKRPNAIHHGLALV